MTGLWIVQEVPAPLVGWRLQLLLDRPHVRGRKGVAVASLIDPDAPEFAAPCAMPHAIRDYCVASGQRAPQNVGEIARCAFESLSLNYRAVLDALRTLTGRDLCTIRVAGGGGLNGMLCQMTADACDCEVVSGPVEASTLGNVMLQAVATGISAICTRDAPRLPNLSSVPGFHRARSERWDQAYARFRALQELKSAGDCLLKSARP